VVGRHHRFHFAGELRASDLGISVTDELLLPRARVAQHRRNISALVRGFGVPFGDRLGLLDQHRSRAVSFIKSARLGGIAERRLIDHDLLMNAVPHSGTRPIDLRLVIPVSSIRRHHIRGNNQPPIRSRRPAYGRHQRSPHSATITSTSSFPRLVATLVALQSRTFTPCMLSIWVAIQSATDARTAGGVAGPILVLRNVICATVVRFSAARASTVSALEPPVVSASDARCFPTEAIAREA
jgi:hypothetical protein